MIQEPVGADEIRRRATGGTALLAGRGLLILGLGLVANIVLARLLVPRDFGLVALGTVFVVSGGYLAEGGLGAALVRRETPPSRLELEAVNGLQLAATTVLVLVVTAGALPFGRDGLVVATMVASLPVAILRAPSVLVLERSISYRTIATTDVVEALAFYAWSISAVALGMGVWGMATGVVVRAAAGTFAMIRLGPLGPIRPRWSWAEARPLVGFGAKIQTVATLAIARDQGLNVAVAAIAGVSTLGVWNLAFRVLQVPTLLFATVGRVSYPALSRLIAAGRDPRTAIERGVATLTVATGAVLVALVGFAPALPGLVGKSWDGVPATLAASAFATLLFAPVYAMTVGYLYATDKAGTVIRAMAAYTGVSFAVTVSLVAELGAPAIGLGWIAGSVVGVAMLSRDTTERTGASIWGNLLPATAVAVAAASVGWTVATAGANTVLHGALGAAAAEGVLLGALALVRRSMLRDACALITEAVRGAVAGRPDEPIEPRAETRAGAPV